MERFNGLSWDASGLAVRHGTERTEKWSEIIAEKDTDKRHKMIDELVETLSNDTEKSGFFSKDETIDINTMKMQSFKLDDQDIYYTFFDNLEQFINENNKFPVSVLKSIVKTESDYFGNLPDSENLRKREKLAKIDTSTDDYVIPSISAFKGMDCAACVEYSSLAHNLWLLAGIKSYFVMSKDVYFEDVANNDGHAFGIIEYNDKFLLCDMVQNSFPILSGSPIGDIFDGKQLILKDKIYANASKCKIKLEL